MSETAATPVGNQRPPWMLILLVPRLAFYGFMGYRWIQFTQWVRRASPHELRASEKHQLVLISGIGTLVMIGVIEGLIWGIAGLVALGRHRNRRIGEQTVQYAESLERDAKAIMSEPLQPIDAGGLVLQPNEACYLREPARLYGLQTITRRVGGYGGASVRVPGTHGALRLNAGRFASTPVAHTAMTYLGDAALILTDKRILLLSTAGNSTYSLADIVAIKPFTDGAQVDFSHGRPLIATTGNQRLGIILQRVLHEVVRGEKQGIEPVT